MKVGKRAVELATMHFTAEGYHVANVEHTRGHNGYDLLLTREGEILRVEVKGCTRPWHIPDPFSTEFDEHFRLVADYLCVIYLMDPENPQLCLIPREAIPSEVVKPKSGYRLSSKFKKRTVLEQFLRPLKVKLSVPGSIEVTGDSRS